LNPFESHAMLLEYMHAKFFKIDLRDELTQRRF